MKKLTHKQKKHLARRLQSNDEIHHHIPLFSGFNWSMRRAARNPQVSEKSHNMQYINRLVERVNLKQHAHTH